ncbi:hypothetical protein MLD38_022341 [Melastoma candidum]|uniref:Uncharacterized protein n=1 Tax=Melastoma candidum TaxID=119954 RepID=A0ACB9QI42_9MYRT|nr:hypothetical protein MLD38_022341 [Melastoma candidum]
MWIPTLFSLVSILLALLTSPTLSSNLTESAQSPLPQHALQFVDRRLAFVYPVIQRFKSSITSDPLGITASWVTSDVCSYRGFYCDNPPDNLSAVAVASIDFNGFRLAAPSLEGFLDMLPDLALFHANSNEFGGMIPAGVARLPYLYELDLSNNKLVGPFPAAVLGMFGLTFLDLRFNQFAGSVPAQIFAQNLDALFLNDNIFDNPLPDNLWASQIRYLTLADNEFTGVITPGIIKALAGLSEVLFLNNRLAGCIPYELGLLTGAKVIDVGNNLLTGPLPLSLSCLANVEQLNLAGNLLYGAVPEAVCWLGLGNLANLSLSDNYFIHVGPWCRAMVEKGVLDIRNNCVPDLQSQRPVGECARFFGHATGLCPRMWSYSYVPCRHHHFMGTGESAPSP